MIWLVALICLVVTIRRFVDQRQRGPLIVFCLGFGKTFLLSLPSLTISDPLISLFLGFATTVAADRGRAAVGADGGAGSRSS